MTDDEEENAVRQICELIGYARTTQLARDLWDKQPSVSTGRDAPVNTDAKSCSQTQHMMGQQVEVLHDALQQLVDWIKDGCADEMRTYCMTEAQAALKGLSVTNGDRK